MVAGYTGTEPPAEEILSLSQGGFRSQASESSITAAGVCLDVRVVTPGASEKTDAICIRLAEAHRRTVEVYVPYRAKTVGELEYDAAFAMEATEFVPNGP